MHHSLGTLGYGGVMEWLGGLFEPAVTAAGDPLRQELEAGGAELERRMAAGGQQLRDELAAGGADLQRELEEGGARLRREMTAGEAQIKRTAADTIVLAGAAVIGLWLVLRK